MQERDRFDVVSTLNRLGLKEERIKILTAAAAISFLAGTATFLSAILSSDNSTANANQAFRTGFASAVAAAIVSFFLSRWLVSTFATNAREGERELHKLLQNAASGNFDVRLPETSDDPQHAGRARVYNELMGRFCSALESEVAEKQALLPIVKAVESSGDAIAVADSSRSATYYNRKFIELFGYTAAELNESGGSDVVYVKSSVASMLHQIVKRGESWSGETDMRARDGRVMPVATRVDAIRNESGNVTGHIEIHTDITERKRSERLNSVLYRVAELTNTDDETASLYASLHKLVGELMHAGNFFVALYDSAADIVTFPYFVDERDHAPEPRAMKRGMTEYVLRTGLPLMISQDGIEQLLRRGEIEPIGTLPADWLGVPLKAGDETQGVIAIQSYDAGRTFGERERDVLTFVAQHLGSAINRERAARALMDSEEKYRTILENIQDGYYEVDLAGKLTFFNQPVCEILGYDAQELRALGRRDYIDPEYTDTVFQRFNQVFKTGDATRDFLYQIRRKDGRKRFVETSVSLMCEADGQPEGFRGILRDVTERRQAEENLATSLNEFLAIVSTVSEGDLTRRAVEAEDTLGKVVRSVNKMLDNFSTMLTEVKQIGLSVSSSATEILAASEQIAVGSQRQADEITNTSSAVEEMAASMSQVSRNAESSADAARRALATAEHGDQSVRDTSEAMARIDAAVQQTSEKMRLLGSRSSEISEIIDLIDDIAAQTNLLALNAAIEAAHAGEAGLGFSVVAEEIRKLAERSARATRDVGSLIKAIQDETSAALSAMEVGMKEVKGGSHLADQASQALRDISDAVRQSSELIEEISAASEEQARVTRNLATAMQTISSITLETSAGAHETAQTIQGMVGLSEQLNKAISQFRVKDDFIHPFAYDVPGAPTSSGNAIRYSQGD